MDIRQLQFLCALDHHRHFARAAEACHVTQPTLSMRLRQLEDELGVLLIRRRQRFEGFTDAGERLLSWAHQAVRAFDGVRTEARRLQGTLSGTLRIGVVPLSHVRLVPLLQQLYGFSPQIRFQIHSLSSSDILDHLASNQLDIGLTYLSQIESGDYAVCSLGAPHIGLLFNAENFPELANAELNWHHVAGLPLGLLNQSMRFRHGLDLEAQAQGVSLQPLLEADTLDQLLDAARCGLCCTLVPLAPEGEPQVPQGLSVRRLPDQGLQSALALVCPGNSTDGGLAQTFLQFLQGGVVGD